MMMRLYSVFDRVAQVCGPIGDALNDGVAWRQFRDAMSKNGNKEDFQLLFVGEFDTEKAVLVPAVMPVVVQADSAMENAVQFELKGDGHAR